MAQARNRDRSRTERAKAATMARKQARRARCGVKFMFLAAEGCEPREAR